MHNRPYPQAQPRPRAPLGLIVVGALVLIVPIAVILAWLWMQWAALDLALPWLAMGLRVLFFTAPPAYIGALVWRRWGDHRYIQAHHVTALTKAQRIYPEQLHSLSYHDSHKVDAAPPAQLALPEPVEVIKPISEWMAWVDDQPHTLLGGKTRAGKTWLASAVLERRIESGCDIFIIDPHSSDWMGLPTAGGSGIPERREALKAVMNEYVRRMGVREEHKRRTGHELPHDYFDPLLILIDEANSLLEELAAEWKTVLKQIASGSRKVGIALLLLAQSPLVEDLGISGAMRENFSRIALDERTVQTLIDSERGRERKAGLQAAFKTMDRPAAAQIGASVWLLDRRGLSPGNASAGAQIWAGWDFTNGSIASSVSPQNAPTEPLPSQQYFGNENNGAVTSPGAGVAPVTTVTMSAAEIAQIATLLMTLPPSEAAKKLDGYSPRKYAEYRTKVETVKNLIGGK